MNKAAHAAASIGIRVVAQICWAERPPPSVQGILFVAPFRATPAGGASLGKRPPRLPISFLAAKACQGKPWAPPIRARPKARLVWAAAWFGCDNGSSDNIDGTEDSGFMVFFSSLLFFKP
ncbi:unnamed protein product [Prunus armeniaca]